MACRTFDSSRANLLAKFTHAVKTRLLATKKRLRAWTQAQNKESPKHFFGNWLLYTLHFLNSP
jgi:hypothetical protein